MGETLAAFRAGDSAEKIVTPIPTTRQTATVLHVRTSPSADESLRHRSAERHDGCSTGRVGGAEPGDASDADLLRAALGKDRCRVADRELAVARALAVDDDLVVGARR